MACRGRVLHLLAQRPSRTGSGVTLEALVGAAAQAGWEQEVVVGTPAYDPHPAVGGLDRERVHPLPFPDGDVDFALPGMSDVMPYESSRFSDLTPTQLDHYRQAWKRHLSAVLESFRPDVIHSHHAWILSSLVKDLASDTPLVVHSHATGLRQMELCPHLADEVRAGLARADRLLVLTRDHARQARRLLGFPAERTVVVGAGYRDDLFGARGFGRIDSGAALYVGKYSPAKGLPWLLDAFERLAARHTELVLHVAGAGAGAQAEVLRSRMESMRPRVVLHGQLSQEDLAPLMRRCAVFVLPSLFEGLPLVVVEAVASGLEAVVTDLPVVREELAEALGTWVRRVPMPRLTDVDTPVEDDLPAFVDALEGALEEALVRSSPQQSPVVRTFPDLSPFTWQAVFERVEQVWRGVGATRS